MTLSAYPEVCLCQIFSPADENYQASQLEKYADFLYKSLRFSVGTIPICSKSIADAILDLANQERSDVIMLGQVVRGLCSRLCMEIFLMRSLETAIELSSFFAKLYK